MKRAFYVPLAILAGWLHVSAAQAQVDDLFRTATAKLHTTGDACAYNVETTTSKEVLQEQFDPSRPEEERWTLLSVDGEPPTDQQIKKYRKQKAQQRERSGGRSFTDMVDESTVERVSETETEVTYRFRPIFFEDKPEQNEHFVARVVIDKRDATVRETEYYNTADVKPVAVVTIEKMHSVMSFTTLPSGEQAPVRAETQTKGKAMAFKKFDEQYTQEFSNYRVVGD